MKNYYYYSILGLIFCIFSCNHEQRKKHVDSETEAINDSITKAAIAEYKASSSDVSEDIDTVQYMSVSEKKMEIVFNNDTLENRILYVKFNSGTGFVPYVFEKQKNNITTFSRGDSQIEYNEDTRNCILIENNSRTEFEMN